MKFVAAHTSHGARATEIVSAGKGDVAEGFHEEWFVRLQVTTNRLQLP